MRGQTFVGMIEQLADAGHNIDVRLDVMPEVNVARAVRSPGRLLGDDVPLEPSMLTLRTTRRVARRVLGGPLSEGRWVRVNVGDRGIEGKVYPGRVGELPAASPVRIGPSSPLRAAERELLTLAFTLPQSDDGMRNRLADWLFLTPRDIYPESIICLDVGQGSAVALTRFGRPKVYFDVGAGCFANARTRPPALKFCTCDSPIVMLSHWDADHWFGAWTDAELQKRDWVCPRQTIGPFATEFARLIRSKGRLLVWPDERSSGRPLPLSRLINWGIVLRATGQGRNDSGLVLTVEMHGRKVLLPGDCGYQYIPVGKWDAVLGTHHGGRYKGPTPLPASTRPTATNPMVLSYGKANTYKHPKAEATRRYETAGWRLEPTSGGGSIELVSPNSSGTGACSCMAVQVRRIILS